MLLEEIRDYCLGLPGVTESIKWGDHLCFCVGEKIFLITSPDTSPVAASFPVSSEDFNELTEKAGFMPAPYLARYKWVKADDISLLGRKEWIRLLGNAYRMKFNKLPAGIRKKLSG